MLNRGRRQSRAFDSRRLRIDVRHSLRWTEIDRRRAATSSHAGASPARSSTRPRCCQRHAGLPSRKRRGSSCWPLSVAFPRSTVVRMARTRSSKPETRVRFSHRGQRDVRAAMPHGEARPDTIFCGTLGGFRTSRDGTRRAKPAGSPRDSPSRSCSSTWGPASLVWTSRSVRFRRGALRANFPG